MRTARNKYGFPVLPKQHVETDCAITYAASIIGVVVFWGGLIWFANRVWESLAR